MMTRSDMRNLLPISIRKRRDTNGIPQRDIPYGFLRRDVASVCLDISLKKLLGILDAKEADKHICGMMYFRAVHLEYRCKHSMVTSDWVMFSFFEPRQKADQVEPWFSLLLVLLYFLSLMYLWNPLKVDYCVE
ncbi:hypothetical protein C5167_016373 [Papaver somniferum]|nr:hypothetical protein C5167_016373 [Papaver somniferum]